MNIINRVCNLVNLVMEQLNCPIVLDKVNVERYISIFKIFFFFLFVFCFVVVFFFFQAEDGIRDVAVTGVQTCALPIYRSNV